MFGSRNFLFAAVSGNAYAAVTEGRLFCWGQNENGEVGNTKFGVNAFVISPIQITSSTNWTTLGQGSQGFFINTNNQAFSSGLNLYGSNGYGGVASQTVSSPVQVLGTGWSKPGSGSGTTIRSSAIIKTDGSLWMFGANYAGQLGQNNLINRSSPVQVGLLTNWANVATSNTGYDIGFTTRLGSCVAVKTDGTLWAWGGNRYGTLGLNNTTYFSSPVQVTGSSDWSQVFMGRSFCMAIKTGGTLWAWGTNTNGSLGLNDLVNRSSPVQVGGTWKHVNPGFNFCVGVKSDNSLWSWGNGSNGKLGLNNTTTYSSPKQVGLLLNWSKAFGMTAACVALKTDFTVWSWGRNQVGQLAQSDDIERSSPTQIGTNNNWINLTTFNTGTARAIRATPLIAPTLVGTPTITGTPQAQSTLVVGNITTTGNEVTLTFQWQANSVDIPNAKAQYYIVSSVYSGQTLRCVVTATNAAGSASATTASTAAVTLIKGDLFSWGQNQQGQTGKGAGIPRSSSPTQVGVSDNWTKTSGGYNRSFAISYAGKLYATGTNTYGTLGLSDTNIRYTFTQVTNSTNWYNVSGGGDCTSAIKTDGTLWTWGNNANGQLGLNDYPNRSSPVQVGLGTWSWASAGQASMLAVTTAGRLFAWGVNSSGQLGLNDLVNRSSPTQVGLLTNWSRVDLNASSSKCLAIKHDGTIWGWGLQSANGLGVGNTISYSSPIQIGVTNTWAHISSGNLNTMAVKQNGTLWAWGGNGSGQLGTSNTTTYSFPVQVGLLTNWLNGSKLTAAGSFCLAIKSDGTLWSWGYNSYGQLGINTSTNISSPNQVGSSTTWLSVFDSSFNKFALAIRQTP